MSQKYGVATLEMQGKYDKGGIFLVKKLVDSHLRNTGTVIGYTLCLDDKGIHVRYDMGSNASNDFNNITAINNSLIAFLDKQNANGGIKVRLLPYRSSMIDDRSGEIEELRKVLDEKDKLYTDAVKDYLHSENEREILARKVTELEQRNSGLEQAVEECLNSRSDLKGKQGRPDIYSGENSYNLLMRIVEENEYRTFFEQKVVNEAKNILSSKEQTLKALGQEGYEKLNPEQRKEFETRWERAENIITRYDKDASMFYITEKEGDNTRLVFPINPASENAVSKYLMDTIKGFASQMQDCAVQAIEDKNLLSILYHGKLPTPELKSRVTKALEEVYDSTRIRFIPRREYIQNQYQTNDISTPLSEMVSKKIRESRFRDIKSFAEHYGISYNTLRKLTNGESFPNARTLPEIALALDFEPEHFSELVKAEKMKKKGSKC